MEKKETIKVHPINTPLGTMIAAATEKGICLLVFDDYLKLKPTLNNLSKSLKAELEAGKNQYHTLLQSQLDEYFTGKREIFDIPLVFSGTNFQNKVWSNLLEIPYGQTVSYAQQAEQAGKPSAVRAVANAIGNNRFTIIAPCHRVIASNGKLTGYAGGLWRKTELLQLEKSVSLNKTEHL